MWFTETQAYDIKHPSYSVRYPQTIINYPYVYYSGPMSDNRQLICANLADKEQPQLVIQMTDQIISFNRVDGVDRIMIVTLEEGKTNRMNIYQLTKQMPLKRDLSNKVQNFSLRCIEQIDCDSYGLKDQVLFDLRDIYKTELLHYDMWYVTVVQTT